MHNILDRIKSIRRAWLAVEHQTHVDGLIRGSTINALVNSRHIVAR